MVRELALASLLHHFAVGEADDTVGSLGDLLAVGDDDEGLAHLVAESEQDIEDGVAGFLIEVAGRFVGEDEVGLVHEGAGDGDTLAFAAGEFGGAVPQAVAEAEA